MAVRVRVPLAAQNEIFIIMKRNQFSQLILLFLLTAVCLVSCGPGKGKFRLTGHLLHINQGQLLVYSPDGAIEGMDTIQIQGGRFEYNKPIEEDGILVLVFPNFSEHPVFVTSGASIEVEADASHLKEMKVTGTDDNELMSAFRQQTATASPPEIRRLSKQFIHDHPESRVGLWLVRKYFIATPQPDYREAAALLEVMTAKQGKDVYLSRLRQQLQPLMATAVGASLPSFTVKTLDGRTVSSATLAKATQAVIYVWSSWNFDSQDLQRSLHYQQRGNPQMAVLGICVDGDVSQARQILKRDTIPFPTVCDGRMFETPVLRQLGLTTIPDKIVLRHGKIVKE